MYNRNTKKKRKEVFYFYLGFEFFFFIPFLTSERIVINEFGRSDFRKVEGMGYGTSSHLRLDFDTKKGIIQISWRINLNKNWVLGCWELKFYFWDDKERFVKK